MIRMTRHLTQLMIRLGNSGIGRWLRRIRIVRIGPHFGDMPNVPPLDVIDPVHTVGSFAPLLTLTGACVAAPEGHTCPRCCHWSLPLNQPYIGRHTPCGAALLFQEWIVYHLHVRHHQGDARRLVS